MRRNLPNKGGERSRGTAGIGARVNTCGVKQPGSWDCVTGANGAWVGQRAGVESGAKGRLELCPLCSSVFSGSQHFFIVAFSDALQPRRASPSLLYMVFLPPSPPFSMFQAQRHLNIALGFNQSVPFLWQQNTEMYLQLLWLRHSLHTAKWVTMNGGGYLDSSRHTFALNIKPASSGSSNLLTGMPDKCHSLCLTSS